MNHPKQSRFAPCNLVIFDFSGTLSLGAILFAKKAPLVAALRQSGLWQLGLNDPKILWRDVISPTWNISSTTARSYKEIMAEKLIEVLAADEAELKQAINNSVNQFINSYFKSAHISLEWEPVLERLVSQPDTLTVVATDHYLEVTDHIRHQLNTLGIEADSALNAERLEPNSQQIFIANSAELGARKAKRRFWDRLKTLLALGQLSYIILVDDFGANEPIAHSDNLETLVKTRMEHTSAHLSTIFQAQVDLFPFFVEGRPISDTDFRALVEEVRQYFAKRVFQEQSP